MYRIQASDQREYGPISAQQLREWITQGRANRETLAQAEGASDWRPLSSFPEFDDTLAGHTSAPNPPLPSSSQAKSNALLQQSQARSLDVMACFSRAWDLFCADPWPIIGVTLLIWTLIVVASGAYVGLVLNGPLLGGLYIYLLKKIRGEDAKMEHSFAGFSAGFAQLLLASLVTSVFESIGLFLCILPGIYLLLIWTFSFQLIIDKQLEFWDAMELSRKTVHFHFLPILGLYALALALNLGGTLLCGVGLLLSVPLTTLAGLYAYEDLFRTVEEQAA